MCLYQRCTSVHSVNELAYGVSGGILDSPSRITEARIILRENWSNCVHEQHTTVAPSSSSIFHETQRFRQWWLILLIGGIAVLSWAMFAQQIGRGRPVGNNPVSDWGVWLLWLLLGIGLPAAFFLLRMETTVSSDRVEIRFWPLAHRVIPGAEVAGASARTYSPLREYGGWGIRGFARNRAYSVRGNQGVQLVLRNGNRVLIGTQRPRELETAIGSVLPSP